MRQGFTLIQISLLLMAASLVLVTVLPSTQTTLNANNATTTKSNSLIAALRQYQASHGRLPCPADASQPMLAANYGIEAANPGASTNCAGGTPAANYVDATNHVAIGMVPVRTPASRTITRLTAMAATSPMRWTPTRRPWAGHPQPLPGKSPSPTTVRPAPPSPRSSATAPTATAHGYRSPEAAAAPCGSTPDRRTPTSSPMRM